MVTGVPEVNLTAQPLRYELVGHILACHSALAAVNIWLYNLQIIRLDIRLALIWKLKESSWICLTNFVHHYTYLVPRWVNVKPDWTEREIPRRRLLFLSVVVVVVVVQWWWPSISDVWRNPDTLTSSSSGSRSLQEHNRNPRDTCDEIKGFSVSLMKCLVANHSTRDAL